MLSVSNLKKSFYHHPVLDEIYFQIREGETVVFMGKNGVGKSTLLRILARISAPDAGEIIFQEADLLRGAPRTRRKILYLGHHPALYPSLSAVENLHLTLELRSQKTTSKAIISRQLQELGLTRQIHDPIGIYSQGMLQRLKLAQASLIDWELLLFDEPFAGLDAEGIIRVQDCLNRWKEGGKTMILVLHSVERAIDHCSRFLFLSKGKISADLSFPVQGSDAVREKFQTLVA